MNYSPLVALNPSDIDLTLNHSRWLSSRLRPGRGTAGVVISEHRIVPDRGAVTAPLSDFNLDGMVSLDIDGTLGVSNETLVWRGHWTTNAGNPSIGHCVAGKGLVVPLNTFNVGYRHQKGWRPQRVN